MSYKYRIDKISFINKFELIPNHLTVIVGPNNSGKSRILKDILELTIKQDPRTIILSNVEFKLPESIDEFKNIYNIKANIDNNGNHSLRPLSPTLSGSPAMGISPGWEMMWSNYLKDKPENNMKMFCTWFGNYLTIFLNTEDRLRIIHQYTTSNMETEINHLLQALYLKGVAAEDGLKLIVKDAFDMDIKLDYSLLSSLVLRVGDSFGEIPPDPRNARPILEKFEKLDDQGDGIKSFVAIVLTMLVIERPIIMIDEPEAFLHPPQAIKLGEFIAENANDNRQIIIATHSSDLLRGILNKRQDINIIRVDRYKNSNIIHSLDPKDLVQIANDPVLSSSRILEGLFYKGAVIVEADGDSTFYQRASRRQGSSEDIHYTHAHGKQAIPKIIEPYVKFGLRYAAIVDFDELRGDEFRNLLRRIGTPKKDFDDLMRLRKSIVDEIETINKKELLKVLISEMETLKAEVSSSNCISDPEKTLEYAQRKLKKIGEMSSPWCKFKDSGYQALTKESQDCFRELYEICKKYGIFIVPVGELESWLVEYGIEKTTNKPAWIAKALVKLSEISIERSKPLWKFMEEINNYFVVK